LEHFLNLAVQVSKQYPVVVSEFIQEAKEIEFDAVAKNGEIVIDAISEHVEFAGVHSGDATLVFPPQKLYFETIRRIRKIARKIAKSLNITGPFNMQLLAKDNDIKVIECNLRASRSFPFVSKVMDFNFVETATQAMLDVPIPNNLPSMFELEHIGVKASQFSFSRLSKADPVLGVDMSSTGEVGCLGADYYDAILKSMLSVGYRIPKKAVLISSGPIRSKIEFLKSSKMLEERGYKLYATRGTAKFLQENDVKVEAVAWPDENEEVTAVSLIRDRKVDLVINIPKNLSKDELNNDYHIRRTAIDLNVPLITNARLASAFIYSICKKSEADLKIESFSDYVEQKQDW
jgi:carbamoyl-phosphate synthase large subunit